MKRIVVILTINLTARTMVIMVATLSLMIETTTGVIVYRTTKTKIEIKTMMADMVAV